MRAAQEPTERPGGAPMNDTIIEHPAFANISAGRVNGDTYLFGSDFKHHGHVRITINKAQLHRGLSRDWHHVRNELIEVCLSEAQWATFVSTMNSGGTPCTLNHIAGSMVPEIAPPKSRRDQFAGEFGATLAEARSHIDEAEALLKASGMSAKKIDAIVKALQAAKSDLGSNLHFVAEQFDKHMEGTVEKAKIEVNAYTQQAVHRAGLDAIARHDTSQAVVNIEAA